MITVISGTNRRNSECSQFACTYADILSRLSESPVKVLALEKIDYDWIHPEMYEGVGQAPSLARIQDEYILPARKLVFVTPEYNGSFPGVVKLFIDACSVRHYSRNFKGKKVALLGVASGRAGNLRGMDHLTGILNYLGAIVMPDKLPISRIGELLDAEGQLNDELTLATMRLHAEEFVHF
jgi:chromate reductase